MRTKEEIFTSEATEACLGDTQKALVFSAMDEYAKQQAVAFGNHLQFNYQPHAETGYWYDHHNDQMGITPISTQDIYNKFIEQSIK